MLLSRRCAAAVLPPSPLQQSPGAVFMRFASQAAGSCRAAGTSSGRNSSRAKPTVAKDNWKNPQDANTELPVEHPKGRDVNPNKRPLTTKLQPAAPVPVASSSSRITKNVDDADDTVDADAAAGVPSAAPGKPVVPPASLRGGAVAAKGFDQPYGVFVVDLRTIKDNDFGLDHDPDMFVVTVLEISSSSIDASYPSRFRFNTARDKHAIGRLRRVLYPEEEAAAEGGEDGEAAAAPSSSGGKRGLHSDVEVAADGQATGGRAVVLIPTARTPTVVLRATMGHAAAGNFAVLPSWRLPSATTDTPYEGDDVVSLMGHLSAQTRSVGGIEAAVDALVTRARASGLPLDGGKTSKATSSNGGKPAATWAARQAKYAVQPSDAAVKPHLDISAADHDVPASPAPAPPASPASSKQKSRSSKKKSSSKRASNSVARKAAAQRCTKRATKKKSGKSQAGSKKQPRRPAAKKSATTMKKKPAAKKGGGGKTSKRR